MMRIQVNHLPSFTTLKALALWAIVILSAGCRMLNSSPEVLPLPNQSPTPVVIDAPTVAFCELIGNPDQYRDTPIRTQATIMTFSESQSIYDLSCYRKDALTWIDIYNDEVSLKLDDILRALRRPNTATRVNVAVVGRFEGPSEEGFGHLNGFKYRFVIMAVEDAGAVPNEAPWPWELKDPPK